MIGDKDHPIRMSSIDALFRCPMQVFLKHRASLDDTSGPAAQTGSAMHKMAEIFHGGSLPAKEIPAHVEKTSSEKFPLADWKRAKAHFKAYAADPRNKEANVVHQEKEVIHVRKGVHFLGHLDQLRLDSDGVHRVYDIKTGKTQPITMLDCYAGQIAGYVFGARDTFGLDVRPGALIRTESYVARTTQPVFVQIPYTLDQLDSILDRAVEEVKRIRKGKIDPRSGFHCSTICPARGLQNCLHLYELEMRKDA